VPGVWGPYYSAMLPGLWLNEGGQSAAGAAIDHLVKLHPAYPQAVAAATAEGKSLLGFLEACVQELAPTPEAAIRLAASVQVVPEFLGNRSPHADPEARAVIAGLDMDETLDSLATLYLAGLCGLGYGARQIVDALERQGAELDTIVVSGGAGQSPLVRQVMADATGLTIAVPESPEPVLLGAAILGAVASGAFEGTIAAIDRMSRLGSEHRPEGGTTAAIHEAKYRVFLGLQDAERQGREVVASAL